MLGLSNFYLLSHSQAGFEATKGKYDANWLVPRNHLNQTGVVVEFDYVYGVHEQLRRGFKFTVMQGCLSAIPHQTLIVKVLRCGIDWISTVLYVCQSGCVCVNEVTLLALVSTPHHPP